MRFYQKLFCADKAKWPEPHLTNLRWPTFSWHHEICIYLLQFGTWSVLMAEQLVKLGNSAILLRHPLHANRNVKAVPLFMCIGWQYSPQFISYWITNIEPWKRCQLLYISCFEDIILVLSRFVGKPYFSIIHLTFKAFFKKTFFPRNIKI